MWDRVEGQLVERAAEDPDVRRCRVLNLFWTTVTVPTIGPMLRLARDANGVDLLPTPNEALAAAESARKQAESERDALLEELAQLRKNAASSS